MRAGYCGSNVSSKLRTVKTPVRPEVERDVLANEAEKIELEEGCDLAVGFESEGLELEKEEDVVKKG